MPSDSSKTRQRVLRPGLGLPGRLATRCEKTRAANNSVAQVEMSTKGGRKEEEIKKGDASDVCLK